MAGSSNSLGRKEVNNSSNSRAAGASKELAKGTYRSADRSRCGLRRRSNSAIIEVNKGLAKRVAAIRIGADSLRSRNRESNGGITRINRGIRMRRTFTRKMTVG
jgi:hypothetical protein